MNAIYLDLMECRNPITGKGFVEYRLWDDYHDFAEQLSRPDECGADCWNEVENLALFKRVIEYSAEEYNEDLRDFLNDMKNDKKGIIINDTPYDYETIKEFLDLLIIVDD